MKRLGLGLREMRLVLAAAVLLGSVVPARAAKSAEEKAAAKAAAEVERRARYEPDKALRETVLKRKAELASLKIGVGAFRHLYQAKAQDLGIVMWQPEGEPSVWDFGKSVPPGWEKNVSGGEYRFSPQPKGNFGWILLPPHKEGNFTVRVRARLIAGPEDRGYGLAVQAEKDGYFFQVTKAGMVSFFKSVGGKWELLKEAKWTNLIGAADGDVLSVEAHDGSFICSVNDRPIFTVNDNSLPKGRVGIGVNSEIEVAFDDLTVQPLALSNDPQPIGSGYDYAEEVIKGMAKSGVFTPAQLGISNYLPNEDFQYAVGAKWVGYAANGGVKLYYQEAREDAAPLEVGEALPLPAEWDAKPAIAAAGSARDRVMQRLGEYLAYRVAAMALRTRPAGRN